MRGAVTNIPNIGFGLALAVLVGIALLSYRNDQSVAEVAESRRPRLREAGPAQAFLAAALDVETGERGYVVTGDPVFLEPFHSGMERLDPQLQRLREALADHPRQQSALAALEEATTQLVRHDGQVVLSKRARTTMPPRHAIATGRGKQIMDHIRQLIAALSAEDHEQLQQRDQEFQAGLRWSMLIIVAGSIVGFAAVGLAAVAINRSLRERTRLNAQLRQSLTENTQMLDRLRAAGGRPDPVEPGAGAVRLRRLARSARTASQGQQLCPAARRPVPGQTGCRRQRIHRLHGGRRPAHADAHPEPARLLPPRPQRPALRASRLQRRRETVPWQICKRPSRKAAPWSPAPCCRPCWPTRASWSSSSKT